ADLSRTARYGGSRDVLRRLRSHATQRAAGDNRFRSRAAECARPYVGTHAQLYNAQLTQFTVPQLRELLRSIPFNSHLGLRVIRAHSDGVTIGCEVQPQFLNA